MGFLISIFLLLQLPLTSLRTYDVTHSRFVTHFIILKNSKNKNFNFFNIAQFRFIVHFYLKYVLKY